MKKMYWMLFLLYGMSVMPYKSVYAQSSGDPVGKISYMTDQAIFGSLYDPDCPNQPVDIHIYQSNSSHPVICQSGLSCPWSEYCQTPTSGFWCMYRYTEDAATIPAHPEKINVTAINSCGIGNNVQLNPYNASFVGEQSPSPIMINYHDIPSGVITIENTAYKIMISKKYGATPVGLYNKRVDPTMNLVNPDPGATMAVAMFGSPDGAGAIGTGDNCVGTTDLRYNPTQGGSHCPIADSANPLITKPINTEILSCQTDAGADCMGLTTFSGASLKFLIHLRNFYYPMSSSNQYPYQPYDDVFGYVTYSFLPQFIQVDYQMWKTTDTTYGESFQQFPTIYTQQLTKFTFRDNGVIKVHDAPYKSNREILIDQNSKDGRWVMAEMSPSNPINNGNYLTLGFYNKPMKNICQPRQFMVSHITNDGASQFTGVVQNDNTFIPEKNEYFAFRTLLIPYKYTETPPGYSMSTAELIDTYQSKGGVMPSWECNMDDAAALAGDRNNDKAVNILDLRDVLSVTPFSLFSYAIVIHQFGL